MKNLIKKILKEGHQHSITISGVKFYIDDFVSSQRDGETHIFLNVVGDSLPLNHYQVVHDELMSVGIDSSPNTWAEGDSGEITLISTIRVKINVLDIIELYLNTSLNNKNVFDKF